MLAKLDITTLLLIAIAAIVIVVLAVTKAVDGDTVSKALTFWLGVIGGAVTTIPRASSGSVTNPAEKVG